MKTLTPEQFTQKMQSFAKKDGYANLNKPYNPDKN